MKKRTARHTHSSRYCPAYPNEASVNYYIGKLMNIVTGLMSGMGLILSLMLLTRIM